MPDNNEEMASNNSPTVVSPIKRNSLFTRSDGANTFSPLSSEMHLTPGITYLKIQSSECEKISDPEMISKLKTDASFIHVFGVDDQSMHLGNLFDACEDISNKYPEAKFFATAALINSEKVYDETKIVLENERFDMYFFDNKLGVKNQGSVLAIELSGRLKKNNDPAIIFGNTSDPISAAQMGASIILPGKTLTPMVRAKYPQMIVGQMILHKELKEKLGAPVASLRVSTFPKNHNGRDNNDLNQSISNLKL